MHNPMKTAVDSLFNQLGTPAIYKGKTIKLILNEPDDVVGIGFVNSLSDTHRARIRISDCPELKIGDKLETEAQTYVVHSEPIKETHQLVWSVDVICV